MNLLQWEFRIIPTKVARADKADYILALIESREQESLDPFRRFMMDEHIKNLQNEIECFKQIGGFDPMRLPR